MRRLSLLLLLLCISAVMLLPSLAICQGRFVRDVATWWAAYSAVTRYPLAEKLICGDINGDGSGPNTQDRVYLSAYLFSKGPAPPILAVADCDGSGAINVADLTFLVEYLYHEGPPPRCET